MEFNFSLLVISVLCLLSFCFCVDLPLTCHKGDAALSDCVMKAMQQFVETFKEGNDELSFKKIDPYFVPELNLIMSKTNKNFQLSLSFQDLNIIGLSKVKFQNFKVNINGKEITIKGDAIFPTLILDGQYEMSGKLLLFQLKGRDKAHMEITKWGTTLKIVLEEGEVNEVKNYVLKETSFKIGVPEKVTLKYDNLIKGNPKLSQQMNDVLEQNINAIQQIFNPSIETFFTSIVNRVASRVFSEFPADTVLPP